MNLQCPNCQKMLNIDDKFAGQLMRCPLCNGTFTAPVLPAGPGSAPPSIPLAAPVGSSSGTASEEVFSFAPSSSPASSPSRGEPKPEKHSSSSTSSSETPASEPVSASSGSDYRHRYIIWISPRVVPWIAPVTLAVVFLLFFFPWRSIPSGVEVPGEPGSQIGWSKLFSSALFVFYLLIYLLALALAIGSLLTTLALFAAPPQIQHLLPWKAVIVAGVVAFAFLLILIGCWAEDFATVWLRNAVCLHLIALIGLALEFWLQRRGPSRPMPRVDIQW